ncbi:MAG: MaoC family dehydratase N-terminal domain-containing protein [Oscillospiraceae bacterium]|nr:MaoC family dehydratase N-terminal domain-containing protein [Oscillospiraceae bacterium]
MYFEEFKTGMFVETEPVVIEEEKMLAFAREYDWLPIHTDPEYAAKTHFGKLIAPGVFTYMAVWTKYLKVDMVGDALLVGKSTKMEWLKPVYAGDVLVGRMTVTKLTRRSQRNGIVETGTEIRNQHGEIVLKAVTEAVVKCRPQ